jgi:hypothetical protein
MAERITLTGSQAAAATSAGAATSLGGARCVQVYHSTGTTARLITVQKVDETVVGTYTSHTGGDVVYIEKAPDEEIFAAHAEIFFTPVLYHNA